MLTIQKDEFVISTDKHKLDLEVICNFLATSYWASQRTREQIIKGIEQAACFGLYQLNSNGKEQQIGYARVITDYAVFAYLGDVFIVPEFQGKGLGKWLVESVLEAPIFKMVSNWLLMTKDAHSLYTQFGFKPYDTPERTMVRRRT